MAEKLQREIYLNGGFVDCVNSGKNHGNIFCYRAQIYHKIKCSNIDYRITSKYQSINFVGCQGQGTSETSYLCKPCFAEQQNMRQNTNMRNKRKK